MVCQRRTAILDRCCEPADNRPVPANEDADDEGQSRNGHDWTRYVMSRLRRLYFEGKGHLLVPHQSKGPQRCLRFACCTRGEHNALNKPIKRATAQCLRQHKKETTCKRQRAGHHRERAKPLNSSTPTRNQFAPPDTRSSTIRPSKPTQDHPPRDILQAHYRAFRFDAR